MPVRYSWRSSRGGIFDVLAIHRDQLVAGLDSGLRSRTVRQNLVGDQASALFRPLHSIVGSGDLSLCLKLKPAKTTAATVSKNSNTATNRA